MICAGSFFGEMGVLFDIPRTASVRALETSYCMVLTREKFLKVVSNCPTIELRFRKIVEERMKEVNARRQRARRVSISLPIEEKD